MVPVTDPHELAVDTPIGRFEWRSASDPTGQRLCYLMVREEDQVLAGFLMVENPDLVDEETRRQGDPVDRRIDTIYIHPDFAGKGLGKAMGLAAKAHRLFDSHSLDMTPAGRAWVRSIGDTPPEDTKEPDLQKFAGGQKLQYREFLKSNHDLKPPTESRGFGPDLARD